MPHLDKDMFSVLGRLLALIKISKEKEPRRVRSTENKMKHLISISTIPSLPVIVLICELHHFFSDWGSVATFFGAGADSVTPSQSTHIQSSATQYQVLSVLLCTQGVIDCSLIVVVVVSTVTL